YVIKPPAVQLYMPPGPATCTSIAYDIQRNCIVFFKDLWRVACHRVLREGEVYVILSRVVIQLLLPWRAKSLILLILCYVMVGMFTQHGLCVQ
ncbi:hypothetical protein V8E53_004577, partial [Lactarius tabidus]